jgi:cytochrome c oxidase assembly protein subunit 15
VVSLAAWTFYATPPRHPARQAVLWAAGLLVVEAFLGAVLVLRHDVLDNTSLERVVMQAIHFTNTMALLAALTVTAWFLRDRRSVVALLTGSRGLALLALVATVLVGATGALAALADTLFPSTSIMEGLAADFASSAPVLIRMRWVHPAAMLVDLVCVVLLVRGLRTRLSLIVLSLLALQAVLGIVDVLLLSPIWMQVVHLLAADIYWAALVCLAADVIWPSASEPNFLVRRA